MKVPASVVVAGVELPYRCGGFRGQLGPFDADVESGNEGGWRWRVGETSPATSHGAAQVWSCGLFETPEEAAANATRVIGLFASLPKGATA